MGLAEVQKIPPPEEEALVPEELETEGLQKQEEEEEEEDGLGILQYLNQLEQVTAGFLSRLVPLPKMHNKYLYVRSALCPIYF